MLFKPNRYSSVLNVSLLASAVDNTCTFPHRLLKKKKKNIQTRRDQSYKRRHGYWGNESRVSHRLIKSQLQLPHIHSRAGLEPWMIIVRLIA